VIWSLLPAAAASTRDVISVFNATDGISVITPTIVFLE
jgi:hypothetical protein